MRVLVSSASKHGGTAQVGRELARVLSEKGVQVDVIRPEDIVDLSRYDGFIIGSAVYLGSWLSPAREFVDDFQDSLRGKPTWLFSSGPLGEAKPKEPIDPDLVERLIETTGAREHRLFSGRLELDRLTSTERFVARWVGADSGDHREWDDIRQWAAEIGEYLRAEGT